MWNYNFFSIVVVMLITQLLLIESKCPLGSEMDKSLYEKLCYEPIGMASKRFTRDAFNRNAPFGGWIVVLGNDIARNQFGSTLKGKTFGFNDTFEDMCFTIDKADSDSGVTESGSFHGFGRKRAAIWNCTGSIDVLGVYRCYMHNSQSSNYNQRLNHYFYYVTDTGIENLYVSVVCFSNGDIGWLSLSTTKSLTLEEHFTIKKHIWTLGFPKSNVVNMFKNSCSITDTINYIDN